MLLIGDRDARLLAIYESLFGGELAALVQCTSCGEELEMRLMVADLMMEAPARETAWHTLEHDTGVIAFRLPNSQDLAVVVGVQGDQLRRSRLLERLVQRTEAGEMPADLVEAIERRMAELDPQADIRLELQCNACAAVFHSLFDIGSFLWAELDSWARRIVREVHLLARTYGWSEDAILRLHPRRRQMYVEMLSA